MTANVSFVPRFGHWYGLQRVPGLPSPAKCTLLRQGRMRHARPPPREGIR